MTEEQRMEREERRKGERRREQIWGWLDPVERDRIRSGRDRRAPVCNRCGVEQVRHVETRDRYCVYDDGYTSLDRASEATPAVRGDALADGIRSLISRWRKAAQGCDDVGGKTLAAFLYGMAKEVEGVLLDASDRAALSSQRPSDDRGLESNTELPQLLGEPEPLV